MTQEKILLVGDSLEGPTGFATNLAGVAWSLADKYEVHTLGLQSIRDNPVDIVLEDEKRTVFQHANFPRANPKWDFGQRSLPILLDKLEPDLLITVNDIQMINHVPNALCPSSINLRVIDLPAKRFLSDEALKMQMTGELQKFKEKFPRNTKWLLYGPQDGDPPMPEWGYTYRMADQVIAMSEYGRWVFRKWFNLEVPRIWHGVDTKVFVPRDKPKELQNKFVVGNLNRNQPRKQPVRAIMAFAKFAKNKDDVLLHMQMDWNDIFGWPLQYFVNLYGIQNKVIPPRRVGMPRYEVARIYNMWDINLLPTGGEGFGLTTIEGYASNLPVLHTDYTTGKELVIDGKPSPRGMLVKVKDYHWERMDVAAVRRALVDVDDLADKMNAYYYNRDMLKAHGKNARDWVVKNCSWKVIEKQWKVAVDKVLSGEKIGGVLEW